MRHNSRPTSPARRPWLLPLTLVSVGALGWACEDGGPGMEDADGASTSSASQRAVLRSVADNVLVPSTAQFATRSAALQVAVQQYADAVAAGSADIDETLAAAQLAWRETMSQWQQLEVMQVGPAASSLVGPGGEAMRDAIYSWPTADSCSVDRALANEDFLAADFFATELAWTYGLDAMEYLLFSASDAHTCPAQVQLDGPWASLDADALRLRRAAYANVVAAGVADDAAALAQRWSPDGDDFAELLAEPGVGDSPYGSESEALDELFRAIFYLDKVTKDGKLGLPLGLIEGCPTAPCDSLMETPWSGAAAPAVLANLQGLRLMIQGGPDADAADGFDDLLQEAGQGQVARTLLTQLEAAIAAAEAFDQPLQDAVTSTPEDVTKLHDSIKAVTDTLKGPFVIALMLTIPAEGAGDAD